MSTDTAAATPRTLILVDVDGVVNAHGDAAAREAAWPESSWRSGTLTLPTIDDPVTVHWSAGVVEALREFAARPEVTMRWCTTWREYAASTFAPVVGVGADWGHAPRPWRTDDLVALEWWKQEAAAAGYAEFDQVVWLDDEIDQWAGVRAREGRAWEWLSDEGVLTIAPEFDTGLSPDDLDRVRGFLG